MNQFDTALFLLGFLLISGLLGYTSYLWGGKTALYSFLGILSLSFLPDLASFDSHTITIWTKQLVVTPVLNLQSIAFVLLLTFGNKEHRIGAFLSFLGGITVAIVAIGSFI